MYKDATVYTGTIVEACLVYVLKKYLLKSPKQKDKIFEKEWKIKSAGTIHDFSKKKRIRYVSEQLQCVDVGNNPMFAIASRACLRSKILTAREHALAEEIMKARNKIHVSALKEIDNAYNRRALDDIFAKANIIIKKVEKKLKDIAAV